jgi:CHAD domain-containing protein
MAVLQSRHDLLRKRLERFTRLLPGVEEGDVAALHRMRVASRRLHELLPILQLDRDELAKLSRRLKKVRARLGAVRELDVLLIVIDELHQSRRHERTALKRVEEEVGRERARAWDRLLNKDLPVGELKRVARKLERVLEDLAKNDETPTRRSPARGWRWALEARVARRAASLREAIAQAGAVYLPDRLHTARIAVKKLRYAVELSNEAARAAPTPELRVLERAQELLGRINDLDVLMKRIRQAQASLDPPNIAAWRELDAWSTSLENSCRRLHGRYMRERPVLEAVADGLIAKTPRGVRAAAGVAGASSRHAAV